MQALFDAINGVCGKIQVISDLFWDFPTNFTGGPGREPGT